MREVTQWWGEFGGASRTWLLLGKGPTFEARRRFDLTPFATLAINHVIREIPVDVTSAVNFDVARECADAIYANSRFLLMPRYPHTIPGDGPEPLEYYFADIPVLAAMSREGRLIWYNLSSDPVAPGSPIIQNAGFSVGILFNLLGELGARRLRTLGVDGGQAYAASFADMSGRTRLANGMTTYDHQFGDMMRAVRRYNLDYAALAPMTLAQRLRLYFSTTASRKYVRRWLWRVPLTAAPEKPGQGDSPKT